MPREKSALETGFSRWGRGSGVSTQAGVSGEALGSTSVGSWSSGQMTSATWGAADVRGLQTRSKHWR